MNFLAQIQAKPYTITAALLGYILIDDFTPAGQNSLGNWFMLVGQVLTTNASQQQVINNFNKTATSANSHIINDNIGDSSTGTTEVEDQIIMLNKIVNAIQKEIDELKK